MAIDIRANVNCSLGEVISGSIADSYIQGSGLITCTGSVLIDDLITPAIGTIVTFSYIKSGVTRAIPRKLRVKSSFADPFRRTTQVELGCKLDYLSDLKDPLTWNAFDDPDNSDRTEEEQRIVTIPIRASSVMNKCLAELGISTTAVPLTNEFSIAEFDFSAGYVSVLSDLLVSESYCGYLDINEVLQVFSLDQQAGQGPVLTADDIIDLSPIGVGQLPGEAVTVSYSTLRLKPPPEEEEEEEEERQELINWERTATYNSPKEYYINYTKIVGNDIGEKYLKVFTGSEATYTYTKYDVISYYDENNKKITKEVPSFKETTTKGNAIISGSSTAAAFYSVGVEYNNAYIDLSYTYESYIYDEMGNQIGSAVSKYLPEAFVLDSVQFDRIYPFTPQAPALALLTASFDLMQTEYTYRRTEVVGEYTRDLTSTYTLQIFTPGGQQAIAKYREDAGEMFYEEAEQLGVSILESPLVHSDTTVTVNKAPKSKSEERPPSAERINADRAKGGDPNNGYRTESRGELELAVGSATAQRRIELSMPYAPDDIFVGPLGSNGTYISQASDAPAKAYRYGRVQNRLLLGNRNGISLQLAPEKLPAAPYSPLYVQANGLTALYRANGTNWAFDSNGIVCSVDALFWAAVGGTGTFWFPVAPGIVTLPSTPPIVDGEMNATNTILPYNETAIYNSRISIATIVTKFDYSLSLLTIVPIAPIKIINIVQRAILTSAGTFTLTNQDAELARPNRALVGDPGVFTLAAEPVRFIPDRLYPVDPGLFTLNLQSAPLVYPEGDIYWNQVKLLLHGDGVNGSTVFTDNGPLALTPFRQGNTIISTAQSKFGGASLYFDGSGDSLNYNDNEAWNFGANNFTIEAWVYPITTNNFYVATQRQGSTSQVAWLFYFNNSQLTFDWSVTGTGVSSTLSYSWLDEFEFSTWVHVAVCRSASTLRLFKNGTVVATGPITGAIYNSTASMLVGRRGGTTSGANGYIDELRITGDARYSGNFSVQTKAFSNYPQIV